MFVITGATGNTGSVVAQTLIDQGQEVRVVVRSEAKGAPWKAQGAEVVVTEITDVDGMVQALEGAEGAYFMLPPDLTSATFLEDSAVRSDAFVSAARKAKLKHAVLLSSVGAQHEDKVGPISTVAHLERQFVAAGIPLTALRPGYFLNNIAELLPAVREGGIYPSMILPLDFKIDMVATQDIGQAAVDALLDPPSLAHRIVELRGADLYSAEDIAAAFSRQLGRDITPVAVPREGWVSTFLEAGLSSQSAEIMAEMNDNVNNGRIAFLDENARTATVSLDQFVAELVAE